jgi:hypothetical protein
VIVMALALVPVSALAEEELVGMSLFEMECREEMNLIGVILQPGRTKGDLWRCIRLKTAKAKTRAEAKRRRSSIDPKEKEILKEVLERQKEMLGEGAITSNATREQYNLECRESLNIEAMEVVQPGPKLGTLRRCISRKISEASRAANIRRRRSSVQERTKQIGDAVKAKEESDLQIELQRLNRAQRTRLKTQIRANPRELKMIRESYRVRSFFSGERIDTRATQRRDAESCRGVAAREWGNCIRKAMGGE